MNIRPLLGAILCAGAISGCATHPGIENLTGEQQAKLKTVEIINGSVTRPYAVIATVNGSACQRTTSESKIAIEDEALENVRIEAVLSGADAVINACCEHSTIDWFSNCMTLIECSGEAIKYGGD